MVSRFPNAQEFANLQEVMDRVFQDNMVGPLRTLWSAAGSSQGSSRGLLPLDVYATDQEVVVIAAAPGMTADDLQISYDGGTLTLQGTVPNVATSEEAKGATWYLHELGHGTFTRSIGLPIEIDVDRAEATFEHGILRLHLPKAERAKVRRIPVRGIQESGQSTEALSEGSTKANGSKVGKNS